MTERRFVLVDFTHMNRVGCLRLYEVGQTYALPRAIAHAATKLRTRRQTAATGLGAAEYVSASKVLTEAEVIEAEAELKALQRHALELVQP